MPEKKRKPKSKAKPEEETKEEKEEKKEEPKVDSYDNHFWSIILFSIGIFILLLTLINGSAGWYALHNLIRGAFGISVFLVSPILIYASYMIAKDKRRETIMSRFFQGALLTLLISSVIQIMFVGTISGDSLNAKLSNLYKTGIELKSGGVLSAVIGVPLVAVFGEIGAKIIVMLMLFVLVMLLTDFTLLQLLDLIKRPFLKMKESIDASKEEMASRRYFSEVKATSKYEIDNSDEDSDKKLVQKDSDPLIKEIKLHKSEKEPVIKEIHLDDIKKVLPKKHAHHGNISEDLVKMLDEKSAELSLESTTTNTIDIPILNSEKIKELKNNNKSDTLGQDEDNMSEQTQNHVISLDKKTDYVNIPTDKLYKFPPIDFLRPGTNTSKSVNSEIEMQDTAVKLVQTLDNFGVKTSLVDIHRGPTVTRYELQPSPGVKISRITGLADDIALNLASAGVRIEAPIPGKAAVGIEVPNIKKDTVSLREMLESNEFINSKSKLSFAVGKDIAGKVIIGDIAKMPHVIIAGSTGSGKSVCTNSIIMSILYKATPEQVRLVLIDPKIVEFKVYDGIPHLLIPVVTDPRKAAGALNWAVQEMLRRYKLFADSNVRDLSGYNELAAEISDMDPLPQIIIAIDELADLMMAASNEVEDAICRLAQMARAAGMHLIIATQRPTVDIITGLIKANIPSRIALSVMSQTDSRTILDTGGADKLLGQGDMLYFPSGIPKPVRVQGCFCSTKEIESVINFIKTNTAVDYSDEILDEIEKNIPVIKGDKASGKIENMSDGDDELIEKAIDIVVEMGQASTSSLQRKLKLGYARAARIMDELEQVGIIGPSEGSKPRKILMTKSQWTERRMRRFEDEEE